MGRRRPHSNLPMYLVKHPGWPLCVATLSRTATFAYQVVALER